MWTVAVPMSEPSGQAAGFVSKMVAMQAFWMVVSLAGRVAGIVRIVFATCASPLWLVKVRARLAPSALLVLPWVPALTPGWNGRLAQFWVLNG